MRAPTGAESASAFVPPAEGATRARTPVEAEAEQAELDELRAAALGRMSGHLAHELRNALTAARCYLELLASVELPAGIGGYVGEVGESLERVTDLAARWLEVARGWSAPQGVNAELRRLLDLLRATGVEKQSALVADLDPEVELAAVEPGRVQVVALALLAALTEVRPRVLRVSTSRAGARVHVRLEADVDGARLRPPDPERLQALLGAPLLPLPPPGVGWEFVLRAAEGASEP